MANQINVQTFSPAPLVSLAASCVVGNNLQTSFHDEATRSRTNFLVKKVWDDLKGSSQNFGLKQIMSNIEDSLVDFERVDGQFLVDFSDEKAEEFLENKVNRLFRNLAESFQAERLYGHVIPTDLASYACLQQVLENQALKTIWDSKLSQSLSYDGPQLTTPDAIKVWMDNPANATQLNGIQLLFLSSLGLRAIPPQIAKLSQLQFLYLYDNQISSVPDSIGNLTELLTLDLQNNRISSVPDSMGNLTKLTRLGLDNNQIIDIPNSFSNLTQLTSFSLYDNPPLKSVPDSISNSALRQGNKSNKRPRLF